MNDILTPYMIHSTLPCRTDTAILFMENTDTGILCRILIAYFTGLVRTSIIHQQYLKVTKSLSKQAIYTTADIRLCLINRYNY